MKSNTYHEIREKLGEMVMVDSHSHIAPEIAWENMPMDFVNLLDYSECDIVSAGVSKDDWVVAKSVDSRMRFDYGYDFVPDTRTVMEKWNAIRDHWAYIKNIGSGYLVQKALKLLCGVDDLTDETVELVSRKLDEYRRENTYEELLLNKAKVKNVIGVTMDTMENPTTSIVKQQLYTDIYTAIHNRRHVYQLEQKSGQDIYNLKSYKLALDEFIEKQVKNGIIGFKWHFYPYMRPFCFDLADPFEAEKALQKILLLPVRGACGSAVNVGFDEMKPLHNYLQHYIVEKAIEYGFPIQIHTGTFGGTLGGHLEYSNPIHLTDLFKRYKNVKFNLLHAGFPYQRETAELTRIFENVTINAAWLDTLSPMAFKENLKEWMTYIPVNKIFAFGSDQFNAFMTYASAENTRDLMAEALSELVDEGRLTMKDALWTAKRVLCDNAAAYYGIC